MLTPRSLRLACKPCAGKIGGGQWLDEAFQAALVCVIRQPEMALWLKPEQPCFQGDAHFARVGDADFVAQHVGEPVAFYF